MSGGRISRRKALGTLAATGLAASCRKQTVPDFARQFVGQDPQRGHLLRSGALYDQPVAERIKVDVLIVGAGVAGAAAAWRLARAGVTNYRIIELEDGAGGTARGGQLPRSKHPMGAHYLPAPHPSCKALELLLEDLGVLRGRDAQGRAEYDTTAICAAPLERHHYAGRWFEGLYPHHEQTPEDEAQWDEWQAHLRDLDGRTGRDGRRLFTLPVGHSSVELRDLDRVTMADYLDRLGITSWRVRWVVDYACRDDYGCRLNETSAFAGLHHFLARGLEETTERFILAWPDGNGHLVDAMLGGSRDQLVTSAAAYRIDPEAGEVRVHEFETDRNVAYEAQTILWAAPRFILDAVLPARGDRQRDPALSYAPWLVANVELREDPGGFGAPLSWDNVPVIQQDGPVENWPANLGYVVANHSEPASARAAGAVLSYYEPLCGVDVGALKKVRAGLLSGDADRWAEHVITELERMHPTIRNKAVRMDIHRWGHAMLRPAPGTLFGDALAGARKPIGKVIPCATDTTGLPLFEEAFYAGARAAEVSLATAGIQSTPLP
jgi:phytoene dehydrogenase-like protein